MIFFALFHIGFSRMIRMRQPLRSSQELRSTADFAEHFRNSNAALCSSSISCACSRNAFVHLGLTPWLLVCICWTVLFWSARQSLFFSFWNQKVLWVSMLVPQFVDLSLESGSWDKALKPIAWIDASFLATGMAKKALSNCHFESLSRYILEPFPCNLVAGSPTWTNSN